MDQEIRFFAFFEAKTPKIVLLDQNLIVPNDYLQFLVHFEWFFITFSNFGCKTAIFTVQAESTQKLYFLVSNPILKNFPMVFRPPNPSYVKKMGQISPQIVFYRGGGIKRPPCTEVDSSEAVQEYG